MISGQNNEQKIKDKNFKIKRYSHFYPESNHCYGTYPPPNNQGTGQNL